MLVLLLSFLGLAGMGAGIWMVGSAFATPRANALDVVFALAAGSIPFLIGTVALSAVAIVLAIEKAARAQIAAVNHGTEVFINEARHAAHHVEARRSSTAPVR